MDTSSNRTALGVSSDVAQLVGGRLRRAREAIGRSTSALSAKIKVREHYLVAIEEGQWNELPPGLNGRGLVRIYARELSVSVPELDQAANQSVMPAEQDAQAPYQVGHSRDSRPERDFGAQRVQPVSEPISHRGHDLAARTSTLNGGSGKSKPSSDVNPVSQTHKQKSSTQSSGRFGLTPEEQPLDVTTPDVASILGISLDMFDETGTQQGSPVSDPSAHAANHQEEKNQRLAPRGQGSEEDILPIRTDEVFEVLSEPTVSETKREGGFRPAQQNTNAKPSSRKSGKKQGRAETSHNAEESSLTAPSAASPVAPPVEAAPVASETVAPSVETAPVASEIAAPPVEAAPVASEIAAPPVEAAPVASETVAPPVEAAPVASEVAEAHDAGVAAAEAYLKKNQENSSEHSVSTVEVSVASNATKIRWAVGLLAACVGVLVVGRSFFTQRDPVDVEPTAVVSTSETQSSVQSAQEPEEVSAITASGDSSGSPEEVSLSTIESPEGIVAQSESSNTGAVAQTSAQTVEAENDSETAVSISQGDSEVVSSEASPSEEVTTDSPAQPSTVPTLQGTSLATLKITEPIEIQLTVDGARIFSGRHEAGDIELKFDKRVEIFVQDGSKAVLSYSGWNHGALGQAGRKRRIVLNSGSFQ